jgi:hypothetical protein
VFSLLAILVAKDGDTMETSFSNSVSSIVLVVDNRVELEVVDPSM